MKSIVLLSGGMDSCVLAAKVIHLDGVENVHAVSFNYRQRHSSELRAASNIAEWFGISHQQIILPGVFEGAGSTLVDPGLPQPHMSYAELEKAHGVSPTYVPFRNAIFASMAAALALTLEAGTVWIATHAEDARGWAYPDCTPEFNGAMSNAVSFGTYFKVQLITPFQYMKKYDVLRLGLALNAPFHLTESCYEGRLKACGLCPTCVERIHAFQTIGIIDPIDYEIAVDWADSSRYVRPPQPLSP